MKPVQQSRQQVLRALCPNIYMLWFYLNANISIHSFMKLSGYDWWWAEDSLVWTFTKVNIVEKLGLSQEFLLCAWTYFCTTVYQYVYKCKRNFANHLLISQSITTHFLKFQLVSCYVIGRKSSRISFALADYNHLQSRNLSFIVSINAVF